MRVRVELRRHDGKFVARFRKQSGYVGELLSGRKDMQDKQFGFLTVRVEEKQGYPGIRPPGPELFDAKVTLVSDDQIRFMGWEACDGAWHVQEWDCFVLPELPLR